MSLFERVGIYDIFGWSVSGNETTVVVKNKNKHINFCFDIGIATPQTVACDNIFISHGHIDHVASLPLHCRKRMLNKMIPAQYYLPKKLIGPMTNVCQAFSDMHECEDEVRIDPILIGVEPGDVIQINNFWKVRVIATTHRTEVSLGFLLFNCQISEIRPEISYLGDTSFSVFNNHYTNDTVNLLQSHILITELTYVETNSKRQEQAINYGHTSAADFVNKDHIFKNVDNLVFVHFSARYSASKISSAIKYALPSLNKKIWCLLSAQNSLYYQN